MRRLLTSAFALLAIPVFLTPAWSEPHSNRVGKASVAPEVQDRAQAELRHQQAQPQQMQQPGGGRGDHGNWQGRGDRGPAPQAAMQSPTPREDRGNWQGRGDRSDPGYWRGRDNRGDWNNNRTDNNRGADRRDWGNRSDFNRDGRTDYRPNYRRGVSYGGPRHDFSGFRDYHRNFYAPRRFNVPYYRRPAGWYTHRWSFGEFLPAAFWARDYWLVDFEAYDLPPPPYGAVWVRVGNDALLVDEDSGEIITVAYGIFY